MEKTALTFCPGHISGWFRQMPDKEGNPSSVGGGIVITEGVFAEAKKSDELSVKICYVDRSGNSVAEIYGSNVIEYAMQSLGITAEITTRSILPMSSGFGLSAASLLASLKAVSDIFDLKMSNEDIAKIANRTEIHFKTGLGDVAACMNGGYICRKTPGIDGKIIRRYDMEKPISTVTFGPLRTDTVLKDPKAMERIKDAFRDECPKSPEDFFRISREFAENSGLISDKVREVLDECALRNIPASMTMLGNGVFAYGEKAPGILAKFGDVYMMKMSHNGFVSQNKT
ncbi:MAG: GHMP kinase [Methanomicrobium sp.]|nr:GHMP kinase [Methanomicrobium sp.]